MPHASGGTRRSPASARRPAGAADVIALVVLLAIGVVVPLVNGASPAAVLATSVAGLLLGSVAALVPGKLRFLALFGVLLAGIVLGGLLDLLDEVTLLTWFVSVFIGGFAGSYVASARLGRSTVEPVSTDQRLRALWDEGEEHVETTEPEESQLFDAIRALDGDTRTFVSVLRGTGRLDVAGDARAAVMVFQCDDRTDRRSAWHHLADPNQHGPEEPVVVAVGRIPGHFRRSQTASVADALRAVEHFVTTGGRSPELSWHGDRDVVDMRAPLQPTD